jgi:hypothetical protein
VLTAITEVLPEESHFRFTPVSREALADILPLEQFGFETSLFTKSKLVRMNNL